MSHYLLHIKEGDVNCFQQAYNDFHVKLYQYIFRYSRSHYLAQEVVQLTFIKLWEKRESLSEEYTLDIQLFRIAKSILIDLLRKDAVRKTQALPEQGMEVVWYNEMPVAEKDELTHILRAVEELPPARKEVFKLSRFDGLSHKEISSRLSLSTKTVENHISKAIRQLKKSISIFFW
ncbi:MAG: sigma-70 family RNA polymerase sigma factor [Chitinophagaceae bacterium]